MSKQLTIILATSLWLFASSCSEPDQSRAVKDNFSFSGQRERLTKCWNAKFKSQSSRKFRIKYKFMPGLGPGPTVGVSDLCKAQFISFQNTTEVLNKYLGELEKKDDPFYNPILVIEVTGEMQNQAKNALHLKYKLLEFHGYKITDVTEEEFYDKYIEIPERQKVDNI